MEISITLTRYREPNWLVLETLESLARQQDVQAEVLFLDQMDDPETRRQTQNLSSTDISFEYIRIEERGVSYARNFAIKRARNDIILFIDSDAIADPKWAAELAAALSRPNTAVAGGKIVAKWHGQPLLIARSRAVMDQYSVLDLGPGEQNISRVVGASFGIDRSKAGDEAYFDEAYGRRNGRLFGGEESDLCNRVIRGGGNIMYTGAALVHHQILPERIKYRWIMKRLYYAGISRAMQGGVPNPTHKARLWDYLALPIILPPYAIGYLRGLISWQLG